MILLDQIGGVIGLFIIFASIVALAIVVDRLLFYYKMQKENNFIIDKIESCFELNKTSTQSEFKKMLSDICKLKKNSLSNMLMIVLNEDKEETELEKKLDLSFQTIYSYLQKRIHVLETIAAISPLMGLLGTVYGMIKSFVVISKGDVASASLAAGISQALITTALGLIVAIPCIIFSRYFMQRINKIADTIELYPKKIMQRLK